MARYVPNGYMSTVQGDRPTKRKRTKHGVSNDDAFNDFVMTTIVEQVKVARTEGASDKTYAELCASAHIPPVCNVEEKVNDHIVATIIEEDRATQAKAAQTYVQNYAEFCAAHPEPEEVPPDYDDEVEDEDEDEVEVEVDVEVKDQRM